MQPLPVNEMFETIQGEGLHCGTPAVFIRLQGCPVGCMWCDTKFTWDLVPAGRVPAGEVLTKDRSGEATWAEMTPALLLDLLDKYRSRHVVLTGGEPAAHDLTELTTLLIEAGRTVQIETSGTFAIRCHAKTHVTVSPKVGMPGGFAVRDDALGRADEIKMPVGKASDIAVLIGLLSSGSVRPGVPVYVQPLSLSRRATDLCTENAIANGWKLSLQVHQLAGWR